MNSERIMEEQRTFVRGLCELSEEMAVAIVEASQTPPRYFLDLSLAKFLVGSEVRS